jgi:hypothetical protein
MASLQHNSSQRAAVEQIVRAVLAELRSGRTPVAIATPPKSPGKVSQSSSATLTLTSKVVSASVLEGRLAGVSQLVVPRGAVFTPAARDEIKKHGVTIASAVEASKPGSGTVLHVAACATTYNAQSLWQSLLADGIRLEPTVSGDLPGAIEVLAGAAASGRVALLVTDQVATALCLANRNHGVRAALGSNAAAVDLAVAEIGPNLLVVDPTGRSVFEMKQAIRHWLRRGQPVCPAALASQLN